jgi:hypothetical protein
MSRANGSYGCGGPFPGAPGGANVVSGGQVGAPGFANAANPVYVGDKPALPLPAHSRIGFPHVTCGTDGGDADRQKLLRPVRVRGQPGADGSSTGQPLLDRPEGRNPYFN